MAFFPQLSTGSLVQFPIKKRRRQRIVTNRLGDGRTIKLVDSGLRVVEWDLEFTALSDEEATALEQFFLEREGNLKAFGFLDPLGNLLAWSEKLDEDVWEKDALLTATTAIADPFGGSRGFVVENGTPVRQGLQQTANVPGWFQYCLSVWARSAGGGDVCLRVGDAEKNMPTGPRWQRISAVATPGTQDESTCFRVEIDPFQSVELFGFQAEAQPAASGYKRTGATGGVYAEARFRDAVLSIADVGVNSHSCKLSVISNANSI